jgi:hypothetical protein
MVPRREQSYIVEENRDFYCSIQAEVITLRTYENEIFPPTC